MSKQLPYYNTVYESSNTQRVKWNISAMSGMEKPSGYVIQVVTIKLIDQADEPWRFLEAWKVVNGIIYHGKSIGNIYFDDEFSSNGLGGRAQYKTTVYWVSSDDIQYATVANFEYGDNVCSVHPWGMLQATCDPDEIDAIIYKRTVLCHREFFLS